MTLDEYEKAVEICLLELQGTVSVLQDDELIKSLDLMSEIDEFRKRMADPAITNAEIVGICFGIVDEYISYFRNDIISDGYSYYQDTQKKT